MLGEGGWRVERVGWAASSLPGVMPVITEDEMGAPRDLGDEEENSKLEEKTVI